MKIQKSDLSNQIVRQLGKWVKLSGSYHWLLSTAQYHISTVVSLRSFEKMTRIEAESIVAGMPSLGLGPSAVGNPECHSVHSNVLFGYFAVADDSVAFVILTERPEQAVIGIVFFNSFQQPLILSKLGRHRCSRKASVLGRVRCNERPVPFTLTRKRQML
jgi:hypothetical protein